jgi:endonuclease-3
MHKHTITKIVEILKEYYPRVKCALIHDTAWQLLVATMLSAQCKDETVNKVTAVLFKNYPDIQSFDQIELAELEKLIYSTGFYHNKAKNIKAAARFLLETNTGQVPNQMSELLKIPGVARKTANVVLSEWFGINEGIVVDTHVRRITQRLGMVLSDNPEIIERDLVQVIERSDWGLFSLLLIEHGRKICDAKKPHCEQCHLNKLCLYYQSRLDHQEEVGKQV